MKNFMKKFVTVISCFAIVLFAGFSLAACGEKEDPTPATPTVTEVSDEAALKNALKKDGEIKLKESFTVSEMLRVEKKNTLNMNGKTITLNAQDCDSIFLITGELTIKGNGTITEETDGYIFTVGTQASGSNKVGKLVIENGTFDAKQAASAVYVQNGTCEIKGGTYKGDTTNQYGKTDKTPFLINALNGAEAKITITGGTFYEFNVQTPQNDDNSIEVPDEYKVTSSDESGAKVYKVEPNAAE